jgi:Na+-translocating ferredoxin:NAD+ oxidoreductase RnfE subunit
MKLGIFILDMNRYPLYLVLGVCPLLITTINIQSALNMSVVFISCLLTLGVLMALIRNLIPFHIRMIMILILSALVVSLVSTGMQYLAYEVHASLSIYILLLAMNCLVLTHAEEVALADGLIKSVTTGLLTCFAVFIVLICVGSLRQFIASDLLNGSSGAFLLLGFLIAGFNWLRSLIAANADPVST